MLLQRMEGNVPGYLYYSAKEGEVVCVFESCIEAEQSYVHSGGPGSPEEAGELARLEAGQLI